MYFFSDFGESKIVSSADLYREFYDIRLLSGCTIFYIAPEFVYKAI